MRLGALAAKNILRNKFRTTLTIVGVALAILVFVLLRTVTTSWTAAVDSAAKDRLGTRHKVSIVMDLPKRYAEDLRSHAAELGVTEVTWLNWFGGKNPQKEREFFQTMAVDPESFLKVYDELVVTPEVRDEWLADRRGALIGDFLAKKFGWKIGDKIVLSSAIFPGDWEFHISGIYTTSRRSLDRASLWFHWDYFNEGMPEAWPHDRIGWMVSRIDDPARAAEISKKIDALFEERDVQTTTMSERAMSLSFMGGLSAVLGAIDLVSVVILVIMVLILGNTVAMGVRERTSEYGVLRAIGFMPRHIAMFVIGEAMTIGMVGGGVGLLLSYPFIQQGLGRWLEENMGGFFPYFRIAASTALLAITLAVVLAVVAAFLPAMRAARLNVIDSLRRVG